MARRSSPARRASLLRDHLAEICMPSIRSLHTRLKLRRPHQNCISSLQHITWRRAYMFTLVWVCPRYLMRRCSNSRIETKCDATSASNPDEPEQTPRQCRTNTPREEMSAVDQMSRSLVQRAQKQSVQNPPGTAPSCT